MPSRQSIVRWGGLAATAVGALYVLGAISTALNQPYANLFEVLHLSVVWGAPMRLLVLGGVVGLHALQVGSRGYGRVGAGGFSLALVGGLLAALLGPLVFSGSEPPSSAGLVVTGVVATAAWVGMLMLGVATLRAAVLPWPWRALPLTIFILDVPLAVLVGTLFPAEIGVWILLHAQPLLVGSAWALLGYALWTGTSEEVRRRPDPVS